MQFAHGALQWLAADAVNTIYTVNGLAFQPKALRFYWMGLGSATDLVANLTQRRGIGFAASTSDRRCVGTQDVDGAAAMTCTTGVRDDAIAATFTSAPAVDGLLDLNSITADGFTAIVDDQAPVDLTIFWEAWGGDEITVATTGEITEPAAIGTVNYTVTGFEAGERDDQVVMFSGVQATAATPSAARNDSGWYVGFATGAAASENVVIVGNQDDGSATADADSYAQTGECVAMIAVAGGNATARAQLTAFTSNAFTLNWIVRAVTARKSIFLAIKGGRWRAGNYLLNNTVVGNRASVFDLPFRPIGLCFLSILSAVLTAGISTPLDQMMLGTATAENSRRCWGGISDDGTANAQVALSVQYDQTLTMINAFAATVADYDLVVLLDQGFTSIVDTAWGAGDEWQGYLAFGSGPAAVRAYRRPFPYAPSAARSRGSI